jgi:putative ABC transport system permease protein
VQPALGRDFLPEENGQGGQPTVLVAHRFWRDQLSADSNLAAHALDIGGTTYQVIGVLPPDFRFQGDSDIWLPAERQALAPFRTTYALRVIGRLRPDVTPADASVDMRNVALQVREEFGESSTVAVGIESLQDEIVGSTRRPLVLLFGAAGLLLLIACTNVASTLLAGGATRRRELVMRSALGARRGRIVQQLVTESIVLGAVGAIAGVILAALALRALLVLAPASLTRLENVSIDPTVLGFAAAATVITVFAFGLWPALHASRGDAALVLRSGTTSGPRSHAKIWSSLVAAEVALAVVLLVGAGLLIKSFWNLLRTDPGFDPSGVLTVEYSLPASKYPYERLAGFHQGFLEASRGISGVDRVGFVNHLPLSGRSMFAGVRRLDSDEWHRGDYRLAGGDYFGALGTPILRGRAFGEQDGAGAPHVTVINEALAQELWPGEDPLGRQIMLSGNDRHWETPLTVIGIAANVHHGDVATAEPPTYYVNYLQRPMQARTVVAGLRTGGDPAQLTETVRRQLAQMDPEIPVQFATMTSLVSRSVADRRFTMLTLGAFAALALILASVGIFGVVSYSVARRHRELSIRLALGASPLRVRRMVVRESMTTVLVGAGVGLAGSIAATGVLRSLLYEVDPMDPQTLVIATAALAAVAFAASYLPALRATAVDPRMTLRSE